MNNNQPLPPDDLPPPVSLDWELGRELDEMASRYFYQNCDRQTQQILAHCGWYLSSFIEGTTLVIACPDTFTNWLVLKQLNLLGKTLKKWVKTGKIRIYPPPGEGIMWEISAGSYA